MGWIYLLLAGACEIGFATMLRYTEGFTRLWPSIAFVVFVVASLFLLERATHTVPIGTAYAVWTGIGAAGTAIIGIAFYDEPATALRLLFLATLTASIIGLKLVSSH